MNIMCSDEPVHMENEDVKAFFPADDAIPETESPCISGV